MFIYNAGVFLYTLAIYIFSNFNSKAKLWIEGRRDWRNVIRNKIEPILDDKKIWVHCASLGEFEQGRPIIESIKKQFPQYKIVLTFFSPSGYEIRKNYELADVVLYLPPDSHSNARDFIKIINPEKAIFVKYEFWLNYLFELNKKLIPVYLVSAVFKEHQPFFKWYGAPFVKALKTYKQIFVQDVYSESLLKKLNIQTAQICGDTRVDRVAQVKNNCISLPEIEIFVKNSQVIIAGSTWPTDEEILLNCFSKLSEKFPHLKLIIAPHEIDEKSIKSTKEKISKQNNYYQIYSKFDAKTESKILLIDCVGILSSAYRYGNIAYIGGGFDNGIHNILEPAVFSMPVLFGPNHEKFNEARHLINKNAAFEISDAGSCFEKINLLIGNKEVYNIASLQAKQYILENEGATNKIIEQIFNSVN